MKIGLVGCGKQSEKYVQSLKTAGVEDFVVTDVDQNIQMAFAEKFNCKTADSVEALVSTEGLSAGLVCTPVPAHVTAAMKFVNAGIPFMCEKPLAESEQKAAELTQAAENASVSGGVTYTYRYVPAFERLKQELENEQCAIGNPITAVFRIGGRGNHRVWKHMRPDGGVVTEMFCHMLDLALWLFGDFESLTIKDQKQLHQERTIGGETVSVDAEDFVYIEGMTKSGIHCAFVSDFITPSFSQYLEVQGDNGAFFGSIQPFFQSRFLLNSPVRDLEKGMHDIETSGPGVIDRIALELIDVAEGNGKFRCTLHDANLTQRHLQHVISQLSF